MASDTNRVTKNFAKLKKTVRKAAKSSAPSDVHKLRTRIRRVQAVLETVNDDPILRNPWLLKKLNRLHKKAGKVRDLDVMTAHLSSIRVEGEDDCLIQLQHYLGLKRYRKEKRLRRALRKQRSSVAKALSNSSRQIEKRIAKSSKQQTAAAASALKFSSKVSAPITLNRANLHDYRSKIRELRDLLRFAADDGDEKLIDELGKVKDAIGEWHDWEELVSLATAVIGHEVHRPNTKGCKLLHELKDTARAKFESALSLTNKMRKTYFQSSLRNKNKPAGSAPRQSSRTLRAAFRLLG